MGWRKGLAGVLAALMMTTEAGAADVNADAVELTALGSVIVAGTELPEEELQHYYEENKQLFILEDLNGGILVGHGNYPLNSGFLSIYY